MIISKERRAHRTPPIQQTRGRGARATPKNDGTSGCPTKKTAPKRGRSERAASYIRAEQFTSVLGHRCLALSTEQTGKRASKTKNESMQPCRQARQKKKVRREEESRKEVKSVAGLLVTSPRDIASAISGGEAKPLHHVKVARHRRGDRGEPWCKPPLRRAGLTPRSSPATSRAGLGRSSVKATPPKGWA